MQAIDYRPKIRLRWRRIVKAVFIGMLVLYAINPILALRHSKALGRYIHNRGVQFRYEYIRETRGETFAEWHKAFDTWGDFGKSIAKCGRDFMSIFN